MSRPDPPPMDGPDPAPAAHDRTAPRPDRRSEPITGACRPGRPAPLLLESNAHWHSWRADGRTDHCEGAPLQRPSPAPLSSAPLQIDAPVRGSDRPLLLESGIP